MMLKSVGQMLRCFKENVEDVSSRFVLPRCKKQEKRHRSLQATFYGRSISVHKINLVILRTGRVFRIFPPETLSLSKDDESSPLRPHFSQNTAGGGGVFFDDVTKARGQRPNCGERQE